MHGRQMADRRLDQETVQHRAVIAIVIEAVDKLLMPAGLVGMRPPDNALMQIGDPQPVILGTNWNMI